MGVDEISKAVKRDAVSTRGLGMPAFKDTFGGAVVRYVSVTTCCTISSQRISNEEIWLKKRAQTVEMIGQVLQRRWMSELLELAGPVCLRHQGGLEVYTVHRLRFARFIVHVPVLIS